MMLGSILNGLLNASKSCLSPDEHVSGIIKKLESALISAAYGWSNSSSTGSIISVIC